MDKHGTFRVPSVRDGKREGVNMDTPDDLVKVLEEYSRKYAIDIERLRRERFRQLRRDVRYLRRVTEAHDASKIEDKITWQRTYGLKWDCERRLRQRYGAHTLYRMHIIVQRLTNRERIGI